MDDRALLEHDIGLGSPGAARWNPSVEWLEVELAIRRSFVTGVKAEAGCRPLSVGIGVGGWDDFLGY